MARPIQRRYGNARLAVKTEPTSGAAAWVEVGAFAFLLILALIGPGASIYEADSVGTTLRQTGYFVVFAAALTSATPWRTPKAMLVVPWPLVAALGWCWLSVTWSIEPVISLKKLLLLTLTLWSMFLLVSKIGGDRAIAVVRVVLVVLLLINYIAVFAFPTYGIHQADDLVDGALRNAWRGFMGHKNIAGLTCAVTIIFFAFDNGRVTAFARVAVIAASVVFLVISQSKTSMGIGLVSLIAGATAAIVYNLQQTRGGVSLRFANGLALAIFLITASLLVFLTLVPSIPMDWFSDPSGLTGRFLIWQPLLRYYVAHPLLGAGYGAFWTGLPSSPIKALTTGWVSDLYEGHNGYFDLLISIGLPGLLLVLFAVLAWPTRRWLLNQRLQPGLAGLIAALIVFCIGHNGTEPSLFDRDALGQVFLMLAIAMLSSPTSASPSLARRRANVSTASKRRQHAT